MDNALNNIIKEIRKEKGISQEKLAEATGLSRKTIINLESGITQPSFKTASSIANALDVSVEHIFFEPSSHPIFKTNLPGTIKYIDLFCGIGGFRYAANEVFKEMGVTGKCVYSCDIDKYAQQAYEANFDETPDGDIKAVDASNIPDFDILFAGFPCQSFSILGKREGFADETRGTLFFDIARILKEKRPKAFVLENVKQLATHDSGRTLATILKILRDELGYYVDYKVLNALDYGLPQKRERIIIVGTQMPFIMEWPAPVEEDKKLTLKDVLEPVVDSKYYASDEIVTKRKAAHTSKYHPAIWHENKAGHISSYPFSCALRAGASYNYLLVDGERRLTPREMMRLQGFPDSFKIVVSDCQARKQAGNSIPIAMVAAVMREFIPKQFIVDGELQHDD